MSIPRLSFRPALRCLNSTRNRTNQALYSHPMRCFSTTSPNTNEAPLATTSTATSLPPPPPPPPSPSPLPPSQNFKILRVVSSKPTKRPSRTPKSNGNLVSTPRSERRLLRLHGVTPIGSRRRRAAMCTTTNIPFEELPYQCFQEARKVLAADRASKLAQIAEMRKRIQRVVEDPNASKFGGEIGRKTKLVAMQKYLEDLKILADINDPVIKKRFEDGKGDLNRPIYRHLSLLRWHSYKYRVLLQRIQQFHLVPDILPHLVPTAAVTLSFSRHRIDPGSFVPSLTSAQPPKLSIQVFDKGERLISIVVVDPDVPDVTKDSFGYRCHYCAVNIPVSPTSSAISLYLVDEDKTILPWLPPFAQKGTPYHRLSIFVLQQDEGLVLDVTKLRKKEVRDGFNLRRFMSMHNVKPIGVTLFRTIWDEGTAEVMRKAGIEGADVEFRRMKSESLPYKKKGTERYR